MAHAKCLSLDEAGKARQLDRFRNKHLSQGNLGRF